MNVLAGVAIATEYGVAPAAISQTVRAARPVARRGSMTTLRSGARIVDDTYNASPAAVQTMLQALKVTPGATRRIAILGEMLELGDSAFALHEACGRAAAESGVDLLVAVGGPSADGFSWSEGSRTERRAARSIQDSASAVVRRRSNSSQRPRP